MNAHQRRVALRALVRRRGAVGAYVEMMTRAYRRVYQQEVRRAARRFWHGDGVTLPPPAPGSTPFLDGLVARTVAEPDRPADEGAAERAPNA